jgi:hypothetical protein
MAKILSTYGETDLHIKNVLFMIEKNGYLPIYYQMALIKGLTQADSGIILYFYTQMAEKNFTALMQYFGMPDIDIEVKDGAGVPEIKNLKSILHKN